MATQNVQGQNVLETMAQNVPTEPSEQLSADPNPLASGSLHSVEVQLLVQPGQNVQSAQNIEQCQFVNLLTSTIGSTVVISKYLVSSLPTSNTIPSSTPPLPQIKTT